MSVDAGKQTGAVTFQAESVASAWDDALPLMRLNNAETGIVHPQNFAPAKDKLVRMDEAGFVRAFTCRVDGKLVAYHVFFVMFSLDFPENLHAICRAAYTLPEYRKTFTNGRFFIWVENQLLNEGMYGITRISTERYPLGDLFAKRGYSKVETCWSWERSGNV